MHCDVPFETVGSSGCNVVPTIVPHASCSICNVKIGLNILCCHHFHPDCDVDKFLFRFFLAFSCTSHSQTESLGQRVSDCPLIVSSALQRNIVHPTIPHSSTSTLVVPSASRPSISSLFTTGTTTFESISVHIAAEAHHLMWGPPWFPPLARSITPMRLLLASTREH